MKKLPEEVALKLKNKISGLIYTPETCYEVDEHFNRGNEPKKEYYPLALYFKNDGRSKYSELDVAYKSWLTELIEKGEEENSVVLTCLKECYKEKDELRDFVFLSNYEKPQYNQKWHYFIGYWCYKEFVTTHPEVKNVDNIICLKENFKTGDIFRCPEGKLWYKANAPEKQK